MSETTKPTLTLLADLIGDLRADAEAAYLARQEGRPRGPLTGLSRLDEALGGFLQPGLHVTQAAPGAGKTAFALQVASRCGFPALIVSAEMPTLELFRRLIARETQTYLGKLKTGELGAKETERLALETAENLPHLALMDALKKQAAATPESIRDAANALRERMSADHCLIVIDSLHIWARSVYSSAVREQFKRDQVLSRYTQGMSEYDILNNALDACAEMADDIACPVLLVAHRNRAGQEKGGLHSSKGSGDIEYLAETIIDLDRKQDDMPDAKGEVRVKARIHKNRNGQAGIGVDLQFSGRLQQFREI